MRIWADTNFQHHVLVFRDTSGRGRISSLIQLPSLSRQTPTWLLNNETSTEKQSRLLEAAATWQVWIVNEETKPCRSSMRASRGRSAEEITEVQRDPSRVRVCSYWSGQLSMLTAAPQHKAQLAVRSLFFFCFTTFIRRQCVRISISLKRR